MTRNLLKLTLMHLFLVFFFCEYIVYYTQLFQCSWPKDVVPYEDRTPVKALILADTHLLGPYRGHWFDKLRREWQMHRAFQTAMTIFQPQLVVFLGDLFDEGKWVTDQEFDEYVRRFHSLFHVPDDVRTVAVVGNHDIGFHYAAHPKLVKRFERQFRTTGVDLVTVNEGIHFVTINSVAMQGDGCELCEAAQEQLKNISRLLKCSRGIGRNCEKETVKLGHYSRPIILQHYPMYRQSDKECLESDSLDIDTRFRETWEVLSQESTDLIGELLEPRLAFSGHSHDYCLLENRLGIEEFTIPSFSWRNRDNPAFALATITEKDYSVSLCRHMPRESVMIRLYAICGLLSLFNILRMSWRRRRRTRKL